MASAPANPTPPTPGNPATLYVVDAMNFMFRAFWALPRLTTSRGAPTGAVRGLASMLLKIEREERPTHLCAVWDAPGRTFRDDLFPAYKAHREPMPQELLDQIEPVRRLLEAFGIASLTIPGVEADDVIATLARRATAAGLEVVICSSDKDLLQLVGPGIWVLDTRKNLRLGPAEVQAEWGVAPDRIADVLAVMGDSVDNVPGVPGIGRKTAADLIARFGSLDELLAHAGEVKGKRGEALAAAKETVRLSRRLVALKEDVALGRPLEALHRVEPEPARLAAIFKELEFTNLAEQLAGAGRVPSAAAREAPPGKPARAPAQGELVLDRPAPVREPEGRGAGEAPRDGAGAPRSDVQSGEGSSPGLAPAGPVEPDPLPAVPLVLDRPGLTALVERIRTAGACGIAVLADGPDPVRAGLVGMAFALGGGERAYLPLGHLTLGGPAGLRETEALGLLAPVLGEPAVARHVHDGKSVDVLLRRRGAGLGPLASDPLLAAYLLDPSRTRHDLDVVAGAEGVPAPPPRTTWLGSGKSARRADGVPAEAAARPLGAEAAATLALAARQDERLRAARLWDLYRDVELPLARVLARVEGHGVRLDVGFLRALGGEVDAQLRALEAEIHALAGGPLNLNSPKQLAELLFTRLALPVVRRTKTGPSTDAEVLEELAALHPVPAKIVEFRGLAKLKGTYIEALPALVNPATGRLHTTFHQAVAATGRLSSSDPNLQNIPIRTELGRRIRQAFVADPGFRIVSADYSQIELRVLAHFSEDAAFMEAFRLGQDIHQRTAAEVFGIALENVTPEQRRVAKAINFGLVFGQTDFGLAQTLRIGRAEAKAYIQSYFGRYAGVKAYMERSIEEARARGEATTLLGRRRPLPELRAGRAQDRAYGERMARNTPIQGSAADLLKLAMIRVDAGLERFAGARLLLTVHDELVFEVTEAQVTAFSAWVKGEMEAVSKLRVPLVVEVGSGANWGDAH